ncbi:galactosyltransferase-domain-containing protein [Crucibulum laeve]|uniref:Hexosyltransferase n=1 Tax=Crucibulum laeve TaxID=68775 RepID=A0A5C3MRH3_9AGAR|nr:galactosyltransferase-domain-containing protein [Crucibulum laeve]
MYPPSAEYSRLPTNVDSEATPFPIPPRKNSRRLKLVVIGTTVLLFFILLISFRSYGSTDVKTPSNTTERPIEEEKPTETPVLTKNSTVSVVEFPEDTFAFDKESQPEWLNSTFKGEPVVIRLAIPSRLAGFERRQALREAVLLGIPESVAQVDYRFLVGTAPEFMEDSEETHRRLAEENRVYNDIVILEDVVDIPETVSEKRYAALKWAGSVSNGTYDYFMTMDSDTFCRFTILVRRLSQLYGKKNVNPREQPVLIGRMGEHYTYFLDVMPDKDNATAKVDYDVLSGPWFPYPSGIGYIISSSLVNTFLSTDPVLPYHIPYPSDDVMVGSWVASLRNYHNTTMVWNSTNIKSDEPIHRVYPSPYFPEAIDTTVINDIEGWHDFPHRGGHDAPISWGSTCIHRFSPDEMRAFRQRKEIRGEWDLY